MAKSRQALRARVSQAAGRRRKKPTSRVESAFNEVAKLVRGVGDRLFDESGKGADGTKRRSAKKTAADRKRRGQKRQAEAKKGGAARIRSGQRRQAAAKKAARKRGATTP
jgi:hypothetical protein